MVFMYVVEYQRVFIMHANNRARVLYFQELEYHKEYHVFRYLGIHLSILSNSLST